MPTDLIECLPNNIIEKISNIIGDTNTGLTGGEIHKLLLQANIDDTKREGEMLSKRKVLYNSLINDQKIRKCPNNILKFIESVLKPSTNKTPAEIERLRSEINQQLAFVGYELNTDGTYQKRDKLNPISEIQIKVDNLKQELTKQKTHDEIFKYCKTELLQNNYFHAVLEAEKGLFQRIGDLSGVDKDGNTLIEQVFSSNPILIINNYQTTSEKNEHNGFCNMLKGLCSMFRNPTAH